MKIKPINPYNIAEVYRVAKDRQQKEHATKVIPNKKKDDKVKHKKQLLNDLV